MALKKGLREKKCVQQNADGKMIRCSKLVVWCFGLDWKPCGVISVESYNWRLNTI